MKVKEKENELLDSNLMKSALGRRSFLQFAGASAAGIALVAAGCRKDRNYGPIAAMGATLDFKDDFGVLNYAYALEQLEAAFYVKVASNPPSSFSVDEKAYFQDIQFHELAHREFFKNALGTAAIGSLEVDFSSINFSDRASVLGTAMAFEDLGVSAYNGAGVRIKSADYLTLAGKIVSVEGRHASYIRDLVMPGSFSDLTTLTALGADPVNALDGALTPDKVLAIAGKYIKTKVTVINL
ncbi:MAG: ferritin-like domain-containing protein [Pedobacter sp.]|nr:ferritin-like domain-containing protein [Pedobacter sp.]